jgi:hypothetical protein
MAGWRFWEHLYRVDSLINLGGYAGWLVGTVGGVSVASLMAWLASRLEWFWATFEWAGVLSVGLLTWFVVGLGLYLYRGRTVSILNLGGASKSINNHSRI